jgi:tetratricopeptide (TPR) repeat protein
MAVVEWCERHADERNVLWPDALGTLGTCHEVLGDRETAREHYEAAVDRFRRAVGGPSLGEFSYRIAVAELLADQGDVDDALRRMDEVEAQTRAGKVDPMIWPEIYRGFFVVHHVAGNAERALEYGLRALDLYATEDPQSYEVYEVSIRLADVYGELDRRDDELALRTSLLEYASREFGSDSTRTLECRLAYGDILAKLGRDADAATQYRDLLSRFSEDHESHARISAWLEERDSGTAR